MGQTLKLVIDNEESITFSFSKENSELEVAINNTSPEDSAQIELNLNSALKLREFLNKTIPTNLMSSDLVGKCKYYSKAK